MTRSIGPSAGRAKQVLQEVLGNTLYNGSEHAHIETRDRGRLPKLTLAGWLWIFSFCLPWPFPERQTMVLQPPIKHISVQLSLAILQLF